MNRVRPHAQRFTFLPPHWDGSTAWLHYRLDELELCEQIRFHQPPDLLLKDQQQAFFRALELLSLIAGVSYYKAGLAGEIHIEGLNVTPATARFLQSLYQHGLAEMLWREGLEPFDVPAFPVTQQRRTQPADFPLTPRILLAMGGGKDSLLSAHLLQQANEPVTGAFIGHSSLIAHTIEVAGLPGMQIERRLDPKLARLNDQGAFNGHVPVTAINSAILLLAAILHDFDRIVFSNEHSANEPNFTNADGRPVNHQYSKSLAFETAFARRIEEEIHPRLGYFSLLRCWNEVTILQRFSRLKAFHPHFSSCNRNFHLQGSRNAESLWCGHCPKCHFTFLGLAAFLPQAEVLAIFGQNLLQDLSQLGGFAALAALGQFKPLECVGTVEESRSLLAHLLQQGEWADSAVLNQLRHHPELRAATPLKTLLQQRHPHRVPAPLAKALGLDEPA